MDNLFRDLDPTATGERLDRLAGGGAVRIERIVSHGHRSPAGFWYDQAEAEWVVLLSGAARIGFAGGREVALAPGDHLLLPAHTRHRVTWTDPARPTVWLAVFYPDDRPPPPAGHPGDQP